MYGEVNLMLVINALILAHEAFKAKKTAWGDMTNFLAISYIVSPFS
jgi:hypothetical protein